MGNTYTLLFSIAVEHTYFNRNVCTCLGIKPKHSTQELFDRYKIKWIREQEVYKLYIKSVKSLDDFLNHISKVSDQSFFEFEMLPEISNFNIITDLPLDWNGTIVYNSGDQSNIPIHESIVLTANYDQAIDRAAIGMLTIRFEDVLKQIQKSSSISFKISYKSRVTRWNYYIINRNAVSLANPKISGREDVVFEGPADTALENGEAAVKFTSGDRLLPLSEIPVYRFKLINENSNGAKTLSRSTGKLILDGLPNPNPKKISIEKTAEKSIASSDMYVYV